MSQDFIGARPAAVFRENGSAPASAISWPAIWAGAVVALAVSLVLGLAAAGLGFTTAFAGLATRESVNAFTPIVGAGAVCIEVLSSALGGYVAGRLRTTWIELHGDESHFRDTAHGLITWAIATLAGVGMAALVLAPYTERMAAASARSVVVLTSVEAARAADVAAQSSLFVAIGLLLGAFVACAAARLGGLQHEVMHAKSRG